MTESEQVAVRRQEEANHLYAQSRMRRDQGCPTMAMLNQQLAEVVSHGTRMLMGIEVV